jgi:hypothetical protein
VRVSHSISVPTHVQIEFGFTSKIGDDGLAGFALGQVLLESCCPSLLVGKTLTRFRFRPSHSESLAQRK